MSLFMSWEFKKYWYTHTDIILQTVACYCVQRANRVCRLTTYTAAEQCVVFLQEVTMKASLTSLLTSCYQVRQRKLRHFLSFRSPHIMHWAKSNLPCICIWWSRKITVIFRSAYSADGVTIFNQFSLHSLRKTKTHTQSSQKAEISPERCHCLPPCFH